MKKIFLAPLSVLSIALVLSGCATGETTMDVGKRLDSNLNSLTSIVTKLDTIDNNYIANPDLQINTTNLKTTDDAGRVYSLAYNETNDNSIINDLIKQLLYNKLSEKLTQNNKGKCRICNNNYACDSDGFCNNCNNKILCDNYGNCTNCGRHLELTNNNTCSSCNHNAVLSESNCSKAVTRLSSYGSNDIVATQLSTNDILNKAIDGDDVLQSNELKPILLNTNSYNNDRKYKEFDQVRQYNYSFNKDNLRYKPRHIQDIDKLDIGSQIDSYLTKVQKLYAMSNDTIEANSTLNDCKVTLLESVKEVKELNKDVINGTCTPSVQQLQALKNYINDIKNTIKKLKNCNGDITRQMNQINNSENTSVSSSVDVINSNYIGLLNHIDTRIAYHESAINTLEQIKYLLEDAINNGTIDENKLIDYTNQLIELESDTTPTPDIDTIIQDDNIDNDNTESSVDNNNIVDNQTTDNSNVADMPNDNADTVIENNSMSNNNEVEPEDNNTDTNPDNSTTGNIDTYTNTDIKNIDTYKNQKVEPNDAVDNAVDNDDSVHDNTDIANQNVISDNNIYNNNNDEQVSNNQQNIVSDNNSIVSDNNNAINNENDNINNNYSNDGVNNAGISTNDNDNQNGVIYNNNLNTGNSVQRRYYYGDDGKVHNTTNTMQDSYGSTITDNAATNNNVNTYGYSTLLDAINQGTVNNGINNM